MLVLLAILFFVSAVFKFRGARTLLVGHIRVTIIWIVILRATQTTTFICLVVLWQAQFRILTRIYDSILDKVSRLRPFALWFNNLINDELVFWQWPFLLIALLSHLLLKELSQLRAWLQIKSCWNQLFMHNASFFLSEEVWNVCFIVSNQNHVIEPNLLFVLLLLFFYIWSICHLKASKLTRFYHLRLDNGSHGDELSNTGWDARRSLLLELRHDCRCSRCIVIKLSWSALI